MHLILKCVIPYEIFYTSNIQYLTCILDDVVICDSELKIEGSNVGFGFNCRTNQYGLFPIKNFIIFDSTNNVKKDLMMIIKKFQTNINLTSSTNTPGIFHRSSKKSIGMATICALCGEYIIGLRLEFVHCILCNQVFHGLCWKNHISVKKCFRFFKLSNQTIISSFKSNDLDLSEWSKDQVLQWLCSVNLFALLDVFDAKNVNGKNLLTLMPDNEDAISSGDKCSLPFWSSITDKFYRESLYWAMLELLGQTSDVANDLNRNPKLKANTDENKTSNTDTPGYIIDAAGHNLREVIYLVKTYCYYCSKILLGLGKQGLHCVKCRLDYHKMCAAQIDLIPCSGTLIDGEIDHLDSSVFGVPLSDQVTDKDHIPKILKCCIKRLEYSSMISGSGSKILEWYRERPTTSSLNILRTKFSHPKYDEKGDLIGLSEISNSHIAMLVKMFFKELPEPLFTYGLYHSFVESIRPEHDDHFNCSRIHSLLGYLPTVNRCTLLCLVNHFEFLCQRTLNDQCKVTQMAEKWSHIFQKTIVWPPHIMLIQIISNKSKHQKLIQLVFEHKLPAFEKFMWPIPVSNEYADCGSYLLEEVMTLSQSMTVDQLTQLGSEVTDANEEIHRQDWYWSDTTKDEVNDVMTGMPDGSYLVRDSSNKIPDEYTLTVRKDGENKLIRINSKNGLYGFKEPYEFRNVYQLILHYQTSKLSNYNDQLNITLRYPVSKSRSDVYGHSNDCYDLTDDALINLLYNTMKEYMELNTKVDKNTIDNDHYQKELDELTKAIKGLNVVHTWCNNHIQHIMNTISLNQKLKDHNQKSLKLLNMKLNNCAEHMKKSNQLRESLIANSTSLISSLSVDRLTLNKLSRRQQQCIRQLKERGVPAEMFDDEKFNIEILCEQIRNNLNSSNPINDKNTWFIEDLTRPEATARLTGKRHGTFLVRRSKEVNSYALDIVVNNSVQHCLIFCLDGMYGFVKNECLYATLNDLVKTFHMRSLDQYNPELKTKLSYPVNCVSTNL